METIDKSYEKSIEVRSEAKTIFRALTKELSQWWGQMDKNVEREGDIFTVSWGEPWYQFKVLKYEPYKEIIWECLDANQIIGDLKGVQKEWVGTLLEWKIASIESSKSKVTLLHKGLVPEFICYDFCSSAWDRFIGDELKKHLENEKD